MKVSDLKRFYKENNTPCYFFDRGTMKFFGDTMSNFGVRSAQIKTHSGDVIDVWELYRKKAVKHGMQKSNYFNKDQYKVVFGEKIEGNKS